MTEDRFWELVNREIDQELSDADRAELDDISGQNPEWADRRTQMIRASELLAEVEAVEAPADLRSNIAQAIDGRTPHPQKVTPPAPVTPVRPGFQSFWSRISARQSYAFAGGAVVGAALLALVFKMVPGSLPINNGDLTGTILWRSQASDLIPTATEVINNALATGSIELAASERLIALRVNLTSERPVQLFVQFAPDQLAATGFSSGETRGVPVTIGRTEVRLEHTGTNQYELVWSRVGSEATVLQIVLRGNDVVFEHSLTIDASDQ